MPCRSCSCGLPYPDCRFSHAGKSTADAKSAYVDELKAQIAEFY